MKSRTRKKVGIFSFTCCEGCQLQILDLWDDLLKLLEFVKIDYFKLAEERNTMERFDIAIVEGAISSREELERLRAIRENSSFLIAIGECAVSGGIPAIRNVDSVTSAKGMHPETLGIDSYVKVDYRLRGCPIEKTEFLSLLKGLLAGKVPQEVNHPVCMECNNREIECLMLKGIPCMGPVACAGCNALCPSAGAACEGCRGIMKDAGIKQLKDRMKEIGLDDIMIKNMLERFSANEIRAIESGGKDA